MRGSLAILITALVLSVAIGDLASPYVGPVVPYLPTAIGQEGEGGLLNDGGTGGDAGDSRATAALLTGFGVYEAGLIGIDTDWYRHPPALGGVACVRFSSHGSAITDRTLEVGPWALSSTDGSVVMGAAVGSLGDSYVAFNDARPHQGVAEDYGFETRKVGLTTTGGDGGSGGDAGGKPSEAIPLVDGCTTGTLASGDQIDLYGFSANAGDRLVLTLAIEADTDVWFALVGPGGDGLHFAQDGEVIAHEVEKEGKWYVAVARFQEDGGAEEDATLATVVLEDEDAITVPYVVGVCKPMCVFA